MSSPPQLPCLLQAQQLKTACNSPTLLLQQSPDCADGAPVVQDPPATALPMLPPTGQAGRHILKNHPRKSSSVHNVDELEFLRLLSCMNIRRFVSWSAHHNADQLLMCISGNMWVT